MFSTRSELLKMTGELNRNYQKLSERYQLLHSRYTSMKLVFPSVGDDCTPSMPHVIDSSDERFDGMHICTICMYNMYEHTSISPTYIFINYGIILC